MFSLLGRSCTVMRLIAQHILMHERYLEIRERKKEFTIFFLFSNFAYTVMWNGGKSQTVCLYIFFFNGELFISARDISTPAHFHRNGLLSKRTRIWFDLGSKLARNLFNVCKVKFKRNKHVSILKMIGLEQSNTSVSTFNQIFKISAAVNIQPWNNLLHAPPPQHWHLNLLVNAAFQESETTLLVLGVAFSQSDDALQTLRHF